MVFKTKTGCHNQCTHCTGEEGCCKPNAVEWSRKNWCCILRVLFAIVGIGVPFYMYMRPCEPKLEVYESFFTETQFFNVSERQPVDLYFVLDGSGSMDLPPEKWTNQLLSTQIFMQTFNESMSDVRFGLGVFCDSFSSTFVSDLSDDLSIIDSVTDLVLPDGGTYYDIALQMFQLQTLLNGRNDGQHVHGTSASFLPLSTSSECITVNNVVHNRNFPLTTHGSETDCEWEIASNGTLIIHAYGDRSGNADRFYLNNVQIQDTPNVEKIEIDVKEGDRFKYDGTYGDQGFVAHLEQSYHVQQGSAKSIMVFISDGQPFPVAFEEKMLDLAQNLKSRHDIIGIMVNTDRTSTFDLCRVSSCFETTGCIDRSRNTCIGGNGTHCIGENFCPHFIYEPDFNAFRNEARQIAQDLVNRIPVTINQTVLQNATAFSQVEETCEFAPWLGFLGLLVPLLLLLCVGWTVDRKKKVVRKKEIIVQKPVVAKPPPPPPAALPKVDSPTNESVHVPGKPGGKRFKWDIAASDQYLWSFSGGATPLKVNYAGKAPPSAPKDLSKGKIKVEVESWDGEDGYFYEKVEVDTTLEEWAEEKIVEVVKTPLFQWLCCCCMCKACCMICRPFCCKWCCYRTEVDSESEGENDISKEKSKPAQTRPLPPVPSKRTPEIQSSARRVEPAPSAASLVPPSPPALMTQTTSSVEHYDMHHIWGRESHELSLSANMYDDDIA